MYVDVYAILSTHLRTEDMEESLKKIELASKLMERLKSSDDNIATDIDSFIRESPVRGRACLLLRVGLIITSNTEKMLQACQVLECLQKKS